MVEKRPGARKRTRRSGGGASKAAGASGATTSVSGKAASGARTAGRTNGQRAVGEIATRIRTSDASGYKNARGRSDAGRRTGAGASGAMTAVSDKASPGAKPMGRADGQRAVGETVNTTRTSDASGYKNARGRSDAGGRPGAGRPSTGRPGSGRPGGSSTTARPAADKPGNGPKRRQRKEAPIRERAIPRQQQLEKELVLQYIQTVDRPLEAEELLRELGQTDLTALLSVLRELEQAGEVIRTRKNRYGVSKKMNLVVGLLQGHPKGFAFLVPDDKSEDLYVSKENLGGAMHGDRVMVRPLVNGITGKRPEGEVIRILERANERVVGRFESTGQQFGFVVPDEKKLCWDIFVPKNQQEGARNGDKVVVEITRWPEARRNPEGRIIDAFGMSGEPGVDILSIIKKYGLPEEFPLPVLREADAIPQQVQAGGESGRWDLRGLPMVTIDGDDAKDLDDAVSLEILVNGNYRLGVHIADVAFYVREGSELDKEAFQRGTSVYLVDRVIPMLPQSLSNGICSLNAGVDRFALSAFMEINREGHVIGYEIGPAVICVNERMTYNNVRRILDDHDETLCQRYADFVETFQQMRDLCQILRRRRHQRGALDFDFPECKVYLDENGQPQDVCLMEQSIANQIIEEFMLMANETVARHIYHLDVPLLYRVHGEPKSEKLTALNEFLHGFGYHIPVSGGVHPRFFQDVLHQVEGKPEQLVVHTVMLRSLQHARYEAAPLGHFGLAVKLYTHFTSPIRRYPDLIVHRVLWELITSRPEDTRHSWVPSETGTPEQRNKLTEERRGVLEKQMLESAAQSSRRELVAEEAERETVGLKKVEYIRKFIGEIFDGFVSSVTNFGMFVALPNGIEGLVHVSSMADDYYLFNDKNYTLTGEHTKKIFRIGDKVQVQLVRASLEDRQIDFELVVQQQMD